MGLKFFGGPYDGKEIGNDQINRYAQLVPVNGDLGIRLFVLMPDDPVEWDQMVSGKDGKSKSLIPYERIPTNAGFIFFASPPGEMDRAISQANMKINTRAKIALDALSGEDRRRVLEAADALQDSSPQEWKDNVVSIASDKPVYLLRVTPELRAFIRRLESGQIEIFDLVREDTLRLFMERYREAGATA